MAPPRATRLLELPTQMLSAAIGKGSRTKKVVIFGGLGVAALAVAGYFGLKNLESRSAAALEADFGGLSACLLGDPLAAGETPSSRFRSVQLAALGIPKELRAKAGEQPWPAACSGLAFAVSERVGGQAAPGLGTSAAALAKILKEDPNGNGLADAIAKVWADAAAKSVKGSPPAAGPKAPKPLVPLFDFGKTGPMLGAKFSLLGVRPEPLPGASRLRFVIEKGVGDGPAACAMEAKDGAIKCGKIPAKAEGAAVFLGSADEGAKPPIAFSGGKNGLFPADSAEKLASGAVLGAHVRANGTVLAMVAEADGAKLVVAPAGGKPTDKPLLAPADVDNSLHGALLFDTVIWQAPPKDKAGPHLFARKVGDAGFDAAAPFDVGEVEGAAKDVKEPVLDACKSGDALVVRLRGARSESFTTLAGGRWSAPVKTNVVGGAFTCRGVEGVTIHVIAAIDASSGTDRNWASIQRTSCTAGGCKTERASLKDLLSGTPEVAPADAKGVVAADVAGKTLLVWSGGWLGGLRMRMGAIDKLKDVPDVVIWDGREEGGSHGLSSYVEAKILPFGDAALLLVSTTSGVRAFKVDKEGAVTAASASM